MPFSNSLVATTTTTYSYPDIGPLYKQHMPPPHAAGSVAVVLQRLPFDDRSTAVWRGWSV